MRKEEIYLSLFVIDMIIFLDNLREINCKRIGIN